MEEQNNTNGNWYQKLMGGLTEIFEDVGLAEGDRKSLRDFIVNIAREQYKAGNKSGIRWILREKEKEASAPQAA